MKKIKFYSVSLLTVLLILIFLEGCIYYPKNKQINKSIKNCKLVIKEMELKAYDKHLNQGVDYTDLFSNCDEEECVAILTVLLSVPVGTFLVSGSYVVVGNTLHWIEKQGRCEDSTTRKATDKLVKSIKKNGGVLYKSGKELVDWLKTKGYMLNASAEISKLG